MVPDPTNSQAFNRYMYCLGNPIRYNDPTGNETSAPGPSGGIGGLSGMAGPSNSYGGNSGSGKSKTTESQLNNLDDNNGALAFARSKHPGFFKDEKGDGEDGPTVSKKGQEGEPEKGDGGKKGGDETPKGDPGGIHGGGGALGLGCAIGLMIAEENIKQDLLEKKKIAKQFKKGLEIVMEDDEDSEYDIGVVPWYIDLRRLPFKIVINTGKGYLRALGILKKWKFGKFKSMNKWINQMAKRGWTEKQISEALKSDEFYKAINNVHPNNPATRFVHPVTKRSVVIDDVTNEILQIGGDGFKW
jgi:hypothetical protein